VHGTLGTVRGGQKLRDAEEKKLRHQRRDSSRHASAVVSVAEKTEQVIQSVPGTQKRARQHLWGKEKRREDKEKHLQTT